MNDCDCAEIFAKLSQDLDRESPPATCGYIEEHLRDCPECIQFVESLKRSVEFCRQYGAPVLPSRSHPKSWRSFVPPMTACWRAVAEVGCRFRNHTPHNQMA